MKNFQTVTISANHTHQYSCADCNRVIVRYNASDEAEAKRASEISWAHECKEQRAANRKAAR